MSAYLERFTLINKPRKQSMRQTVDEYSPTYKRAVASIRRTVDAPLKSVPDEPARFARGTRVKPK